MDAGNVRCPMCSRVLKPPNNVPRFRCPCGQILARPRNQPNNPVRNIPAVHATPRVQQQYQQPAQQQVNHQQPASTTRVRCPQCSTVLIPPPGAAVFRCTCGLTLRAPNPAPVQNNPSAQVRNVMNNVRTNDGTATMSRPQGIGTNANNPAPRRTGMMGRFRNAISSAAATNTSAADDATTNVNNSSTTPTTGRQMDDKLSPDEVVEQLTGSNKEFWLRNLAEGDKICWVRLMSSEQEEKITKLLTTWEKDMKENIDELEEYDLKTRVDMLEVYPSVNRSDMEAMKKTILGAKADLLRRQSMSRITAILNNLHVDHTTCINLQQLVERLLAAVWYGPTRLCDGFVREFKGDLELDMIPAQQYGLDLRYKELKIQYYTLENLTQASFTKKVAWFKEQCDKNRTPWEDGRVEIKINRSELLQDSFYKFRKLKSDDFKKSFKFEFIGEQGIDAGGLSREWFEQITDACFNVDCGLFEYSGVDNICYQFNPNSGIANEYHLEYFRFIGRIVGKALFDQKYIKAHLTQPLFKHILGYPITVDDIEYCDQQIYENLKQLEDLEDVSLLMLTFSCTVSVFGEITEIELKPGGAELDVTNANVQEYVLLMTKYYMFARTKGQLVYFLKGIYDVIPEVWLSIFDYREFELLLCGLPNINVNDWKANTNYRGEYVKKKANHKVIKWFWQYVESRNQEERAKLLQFCTGTSRVPVAGFSALQGRSGQVTPFVLESADIKKKVYPVAHTCFNRLELPLYKTKAHLYQRLSEACSSSLGDGAGFFIE